MSVIIKNQRPSTSSKTTKKKQSYKFKYNTETPSKIPTP